MPGKKFLDRIRDQVRQQSPNLQSLIDKGLNQAKDRIKQELEPSYNLPAYDGRPEDVEPSFSDRIKNTIKEKVRNIEPIRNRMLDPGRALDLPTLKYRIHYAGQNRVLLYLEYNGTWRHFVPMSYRNRGKDKSQPLLYGICMLHDSVHSLILSKITGCLITDEPFLQPDYPIEV